MRGGHPQSDGTFTRYRGHEGRYGSHVECFGMQLPPLGPLTGFQAPARASNSEHLWPKMLEFNARDETRISGFGQLFPERKPHGILPPAPIGGIPGLIATEATRELLSQISQNGYRFSLGTKPLELEQVGPGKALPGLTVSPESRGVTKEIAGLIATMSPPETQKISIASWDDLHELAAIASGEVAQLRNPKLGQTLLDLEKAGARLYVGGADYDPETAGKYLHSKMLILDNHDRLSSLFPRLDESAPRLAGAYGAYREDLRGTLWVAPPGADEPSRVDSLATVRYFVLGEGEAPDDLARRVQELSQQGLGFARESRDIGALGAYSRMSQGKPVEVTIQGVPVGSVAGSPEVPREVMAALAYSKEHPKTPAATLQAIAVPTGLTPEENLALLARLEAAESKNMIRIPMRVFGPSESQRALETLARTRLPDQSLNDLVDLFVAIRGQTTATWAAGAAAHLLAHPEEKDRLLALGRLRGADFQDSLKAHEMIPDAEHLEAFEHLALKKTHEPVKPALHAFQVLQERRWEGVSLAEDARMLGALGDRLGYDEAWTVRERLQPDQVDVFLREHALSRDVESAFRCLAPGGHPELPEPLELREKVARMVDPPLVIAGWDMEGVDLNAIYRGEKPDRPPRNNYEFLLRLPNRELLADATLLAGALECVERGPARDLVKDFRAGKLGRLSVEELVQRLKVESALLGEDQKALASIRQGVPNHEQRREQAEKLRQRFGDTVHEEFAALETALPPETSWDQGLAALGRLSEVFPPKEAREAYVELVDSLREGAWSGRSLSEGVEALIRVALVSDLERARKGLATAPADGAHVAGVSLQNGGVTIGGVRLRTRS